MAACCYCCHHFIFLKIKIRLQSYWPYLQWHPWIFLVLNGSFGRLDQRGLFSPFWLDAELTWMKRTLTSRLVHREWILLAITFGFKLYNVMVNFSLHCSLGVWVHLQCCMSQKYHFGQINNNYTKARGVGWTLFCFSLLYLWQQCQKKLEVLMMGGSITNKHS